MICEVSVTATLRELCCPSVAAPSVIKHLQSKRVGLHPHNLILNYMGFHTSYSAQAGDGYGKLQDRNNDQGASVNLRR